ncbi:MAG: serine/threonine protein kinase [Kofleriaceae bacterium]|nr:serine/threonine protein kinase [Kofleriaceae bacterium]
MTIPAGIMVPSDARDFGQYELIAKLATGGMAEIFLARPAGHADGKLLVLKRILPHLAEDEHFVTMFRDEADLASKLIHPNVCRVHALGHHAGSWFIAMEYLHGVPLSRVMTRLSKQNKLLDLRVVAGIICAACEGLHHAHELRDANGNLLNVVHRDVSPPNIMVVEGGLVKLLDFGIAKATNTNAKTRTGTVKGKNAYMSPEQIMGKSLDRRSDIFALGTVMYELLTIKRLFHRDSDFMTFKAISEEPIPDIMQRRPDLPLGLRSVLLQALARDPAGRFATAKQFGDAIRGAMMNLGGPATTTDLAIFLSQDFGDELAAHDEILRAADDDSAIPASSPANSASKSQGHRLPSAPPIPLVSREGELANAQRSKRDSIGIGVPSMIVSAPTGRAGTAPIAPFDSPSQPNAVPTDMLLGTANTAPYRQSVPVATGAMLSDSFAMPLAAPSSPSFDLGMDDAAKLLGASRNRTMRNLAVIAVVAAIAIAAVLVLNRSEQQQPIIENAIVVDAAPPPPPPIDAPKNQMSREDIAAMSRYGFLTMDSDPKAKLFLDDKLIGETPFKRFPLAPGNYKAKVVGAGGKKKLFDLTIYGGKDAELGAVNWAAK